MIILFLVEKRKFKNYKEEDKSSLVSLLRDLVLSYVLSVDCL